MSKLQLCENSTKLQLCESSTKLQLCTEECSYLASNGNEYTNDFSSAVGFTQNRAGDLLSLSGGQLLFTENAPAATGITYGYRSYSGATSRVIIEATVLNTGNSATTGIFIGVAGVYRYAIFARWGFGNFGFYYNSAFSSINKTIISGVKLTLDINYNGTDTLFCFYSGENLLKSEVVAGSNAVPAAENYGVLCSGVGVSTPRQTGRWDDFTLQVD